MPGGRVKVFDELDIDVGSAKFLHGGKPPLTCDENAIASDSDGIDLTEGGDRPREFLDPGQFFPLPFVSFNRDRVDREGFEFA